jgi:hypothetical protein
MGHRGSGCGCGRELVAKAMVRRRDRVLAPPDAGAAVAVALLVAAHLLDCLVDAQRRAPHSVRARRIAALARTVRLRNLGSWTNDYYDDIAWPGGAARRPAALPLRVDGDRCPTASTTTGGTAPT